MVSVRAYVGLGSNLAGPVRQLQDAIRALADLPDTRLIAVSGFYRTAPVGYLDQPDFVNAVASLDTSLSARNLLDELLVIERRHGRVRTRLNGPRTLDLDLLLFGDVSLDEAGLTLPHPRMHERAFVLVPLAEIASDLVLAGRGPVRELADRASGAQPLEVLDGVHLA
ncbi:MAG: 2-amino-4-hydroxy-6-hydroxymethyldihydropteridine diphosphokinase [Betaproteobacteria bacterium]